MTVIHDGKKIPKMSEPFDPSDQEWVYFGWSEYLDNDNIDIIQWTVPDGWAVVASYDDVTIQTDDANSTVMEHVSMALLSASDVNGTYVIACKMTTDAVPPRIFERSVKIKVKNL